MIRKQLYIEDRQEKALKRRAKALGVSEADIVRRALDAALDDGRQARPLPRHREALARVLERAARFASERRRLSGTPGYRREELYDERESRWERRS